MSLQARVWLSFLLMLALSVAAMSALLWRTYDSQLQAVARDRLQQDLPLLRGGLDEIRLRDLHLIELVALNPDVVSATAAHDSAALDKLLGPLRGQTLPAAQFMAVVDPQGQIISTDPFTNLNLAGDIPVKDSLQGRAVLNVATTTNSVLLARAAGPQLSIEA
ncbi:MAG TPA: hypothetical protein VF157_12385, partial [Chloroflexota bacterium]